MILDGSFLNFQKIRLKSVKFRYFRYFLSLWDSTAVCYIRKFVIYVRNCYNRKLLQIRVY